MATAPMEDLLRLMLDEKASDLHLTVGAPPALRIQGAIKKLHLPALTPEDTENLVRSITSDYHMNRIAETGTADYAISFREGVRFRVSSYRLKGEMAIAVRLIPREIMTLGEIGLPQSVRSLLDLPRGLILVTGPTGSGKTTTLASMLHTISHTQQVHIITIEDPIEYFHSHGQGLLNQREIGADVPNFADALKHALRQDPDVLLVGEMRDLETMEAAISAAETGHLVFSTLHTTGAARTVDRIIDSFPENRQEQIRVQLSANLKAVISQVLLPRSDQDGRIAAFEIMINTPSIANLIRENKSFRIRNDILTGTKHGMVSLEANLARLCRDGVISYENMIQKAEDTDAVLRFYHPEIDSPNP